MELLRKIEKEVYNTEEFNHSWLTDEVSDLYSEDRETAHISVLCLCFDSHCYSFTRVSCSDYPCSTSGSVIAKQLSKVNGAGMKDLYLLLFRSKYIKVIGGAFYSSLYHLSYYFATYLYDNIHHEKAPVGIGELFHCFTW